MYGLVILHNAFSLKVFSKQLIKSLPNIESVFTIDAPKVLCKKAEDYSAYQIAQSKRIKIQIDELGTRLETDESHISPEFVILESNYGAPGKSIFCEALYENLKSLYPDARFMVLSTTTGSLAKALEIDNELIAIDPLATPIDLENREKHRMRPSVLADRIVSKTAAFAILNEAELVVTEQNNNEEILGKGKEEETNEIVTMSNKILVFSLEQGEGVSEAGASISQEETKPQRTSFGFKLT